MSETETGTPAARRRKIFLLADDAGLDRDARISLACYLLRRDIVSWKHLDDSQVNRLLDALEGFQLIAELRRQSA